MAASVVAIARSTRGCNCKRRFDCRCKRGADRRGLLSQQLQEGRIVVQGRKNVTAGLENKILISEGLVLQPKNPNQETKDAILLKADGTIAWHLKSAARIDWCDNRLLALAPSYCVPVHRCPYLWLKQGLSVEWWRQVWLIDSTSGSHQRLGQCAGPNVEPFRTASVWAKPQRSSPLRHLEGKYIDNTLGVSCSRIFTDYRLGLSIQTRRPHFFSSSYFNL